ncbi:glycosyltransferase family 2 protein [Pseudoalteromonas aurantia]|uniref:glycosyltransferase family 2 protein n=1 Tax=Pseudoalteromonas aurantia TaxID=43654 RepID=UPI0017883C19|nr:glycosyltransferase family 2 protein [Pseudoalteromonas aurantia]
MKFTVIIPFYNQQRFVSETISSVLAAIRDEDEIIAIDDCSADATFSILQECAKNEPRLAVYKNDVNLRQVKTLNRAASMASGNILVVLGGDDLLGHGFVEQLIPHFDEGIDVAFSPVCFFHDISEINYSASCSRSNDTLSFYDALFGWGSKAGEKYSIIGCAIRKSTFLELGGFSENVVIEDHDFFLKATKHKKLLRLIGGRYAFYRQVPGSISSNMRRMIKEDYRVIKMHAHGATKYLAMSKRLLIFLAVFIKRQLRGKRGV